MEAAMTKADGASKANMWRFRAYLFLLCFSAVAALLHGRALLGGIPPARPGLDMADQGSTSNNSQAQPLPTIPPGISTQELTKPSCSAGALCGAGAEGREDEAWFWRNLVSEAKAYYARDGLSRTCAKDRFRMPIFEMQKLRHGNTGTFHTQRFVAETPPARMLRMWRLPEMAADYDDVGQGRWMTSASKWMDLLPEGLIGNPSHGLSQNVSSSALSQRSGDTVARHLEHLSSLAEVSHGYNETPGILVLHNAKYHSSTLTMTDCKVVWWGGCFKRKFGIYSASIEHHDMCAPGGGANRTHQRHEHVVALQNVMRRFFYHQMTETLARAMTVEGLLRTFPDMRVTGISSGSDIYRSLGLRNAQAAFEGCATYLWIPETARCSGVNVALLHVTRGVFTRLFRSAPELVRHPSEATLTDATGRASKLPYVVVVQRLKTSRSIANHAELVAALRARFSGTHAVVVHPGTQPLTEQFALFAFADGVIGPHGAGLSMIMAMRKGAAVFEFLPEQGINTCYMAMAYQLELAYLAAIPPGSQFGAPMAVDVAAGVAGFAGALLPPGSHAA